MRDLDVDLEAEIAEPRLRPIILYQGEFSTGTLYLWSGYGDLVWNGDTYTGAGTFLGVSAIEETSETKAMGASVSLSGVSLTALSIVLQTVRIGNVGSLYFACLDDANALVGEPTLLFQGTADVPSINDSGDSCDISLSYESKLIELTRAKGKRFTDAAQQGLYPGDLGFAYVNWLQSRDIVWGGDDARVEKPGYRWGTQFGRPGLHQIPITPAPTVSPARPVGNGRGYTIPVTNTVGRG